MFASIFVPVFVCGGRFNSFVDIIIIILNC